MWKMFRRDEHRGWVLPDALLALSIVSLTIISAQDFLRTTHHLEQQRQERLAQVRYQHDLALAAWVTAQ